MANTLRYLMEDGDIDQNDLPVEEVGSIFDGLSAEEEVVAGVEDRKYAPLLSYVVHKASSELLNNVHFDMNHRKEMHKNTLSMGALDKPHPDWQKTLQFYKKRPTYNRMHQVHFLQNFYKACFAFGRIASKAKAYFERCATAYDKKHPDYDTWLSSETDRLADYIADFNLSQDLFKLQVDGTSAALTTLTPEDAPKKDYVVNDHKTLLALEQISVELYEVFANTLNNTQYDLFGSAAQRALAHCKKHYAVNPEFTDSFLAYTKLLYGINAAVLKGIGEVLYDHLLPVTPPAQDKTPTYVEPMAEKYRRLGTHKITNQVTLGPKDIVTGAKIGVEALDTELHFTWHGAEDKNFAEAFLDSILVEESTLFAPCEEMKTLETTTKEDYQEFKRLRWSDAPTAKEELQDIYKEHPMFDVEDYDKVVSAIGKIMGSIQNTMTHRKNGLEEAITPSFSPEEDGKKYKESFHKQMVDLFELMPFISYGVDSEGQRYAYFDVTLRDSTVPPRPRIASSVEEADEHMRLCVSLIEDYTKLRAAMREHLEKTNAIYIQSVAPLRKEEDLPTVARYDFAYSWFIDTLEVIEVIDAFLFFFVSSITVPDKR